MSNRLVNFLNKHNILDDNQFGFRSRHSTTQASMLITDKIQRKIESKLYFWGIFLDLSKALDTVDHNIPLATLEHNGIWGLLLRISNKRTVFWLDQLSITLCA